MSVSAKDFFLLFLMLLFLLQVAVVVVVVVECCLVVVSDGCLTETVSSSIVGDGDLEERGLTREAVDA